MLAPTPAAAAPTFPVASAPGLSLAATAPHLTPVGAAAHAPAAPVAATPERISVLAGRLLAGIRGSIREIAGINLQARILSINAQIQAARAGEAGRSFGVVSREMVNLSERTQAAAGKLVQESEAHVLELAEISRHLGSDVRGTRLADLARVNIDLVDRNLYERSCDCRWWATDSAFVNALTQPSPALLDYAGARMAVILKAYTVYFDIVLADRRGQIVANGRHLQYASRSRNCATAPWFTSAMATATGDDFGFESVHASPLVDGRRVLVYSCKVCRDGQANGEPLGVLGVIFNWDGLAQKIVDETPLTQTAQGPGRACIIDPRGNILADSQSHLGPLPELPARDAFLAVAKNYITLPQASGRPLLVAHAQSPGFETYRTGWHSLIFEPIPAETT